MMKKLKRGMICILNPIWEGNDTKLGDRLIKRNKGVKVKIVRKSMRKDKFVVERIDKQEFLPGEEYSGFGLQMDNVIPIELLPLNEKKMKFKL